MITKELFNSIFPTTGLTSARNLRKYNLIRERDKLIDALNRILPKYKINNYFRISAFFANCGVETDFFKTTSEYADGWDYDISVRPSKAQELGNYKKGDGPRYKGSGLSQTTGGFNFAQVQKRIGKKLGVDVVKNPELLRNNIDLAVESACIYWDDHNLNELADRGEFRALSGIVNRGDADLKPLHWEKRNTLYSLCKRRIPKNFAFAPAPMPIVSAIVGGSSYTTQTDDTRVPSGYDSVVVTPTENGEDTTATVPPTDSNVAPPTDSTVPAEAPPESAFKKLLNKYVLHSPTDSWKNILFIVAARIGGWATFLWNLGLHGKILTFLVAFGAIVPTVYAVVKYKSRIWEWIESTANSFLQE